MQPICRYTYTAVAYIPRAGTSHRAVEFAQDIGSLGDARRFARELMPRDASHADLWRDDNVALRSTFVEPVVPTAPTNGPTAYRPGGAAHVTHEVSHAEAWLQG